MFAEPKMKRNKRVYWGLYPTFSTLGYTRESAFLHDYHSRPQWKPTKAQYETMLRLARYEFVTGYSPLTAHQHIGEHRLAHRTTESEKLGFSNRDARMYYGTPAYKKVFKIVEQRYINAKKEELKGFERGRYSEYKKTGNLPSIEPGREIISHSTKRKREQYKKVCRWGTDICVNGEHSRSGTGVWR